MKKIFLLGISLCILTCFSMITLSFGHESHNHSALKGQSTHLLYQQAVEHYHLGKYQPSLAALSRVIHLDPSHVKAKKYVKKIYSKAPHLKGLYKIDLSTPEIKPNLPYKKKVKRSVKKTIKQNSPKTYTRTKYTPKNQNRIDQLDQEIKSLKSQLTTTPYISRTTRDDVDVDMPKYNYKMETRLRDAFHEVDDYRAQLRDKDRMISEQNQKLRRLQKDKANIEAQIYDLNQEASARDNELNDLADQLRQAKSTYEFREEDLNLHIEKLQRELNHKQDIIHDQESFISSLENELTATEANLKKASTQQNTQDLEKLIIERDQIIARLKSELAELKRYYSDADDMDIDLSSSYNTWDTSTATVAWDVQYPGDRPLPQKVQDLQSRLQHLQGLLEQKNAQIKSLQQSTQRQVGI